MPTRRTPVWTAENVTGVFLLAGAAGSGIAFQREINVANTDVRDVFGDSSPEWLAEVDVDVHEAGRRDLERRDRRIRQGPYQADTQSVADARIHARDETGLRRRYSIEELLSKAPAQRVALDKATWLPWE